MKQPSSDLTFTKTELRLLETILDYRISDMSVDYQQRFEEGEDYKKILKSQRSNKALTTYIEILSKVRCGLDDMGEKI